MSLNNKIKKIKYIIIICTALICIASCSSTDNSKVVTQVNKGVKGKYSPEFTDVSFETSKEDMLNIEGKPVEEYPSLYNGTVYRFADKEYLGLNGSVKYMTDDIGNIACIAFLYESDDEEELSKAYESIHGKLMLKYGDSGNSSKTQGNYGDLWYFDDVHIQISAVVTSEYKGLQLSYMNADYSLKDVVDQKKKDRQNTNP